MSHWIRYPESRWEWVAIACGMLYGGAAAYDAAHSQSYPERDVSEFAAANPLVLALLLAMGWAIGLLFSFVLFTLLRWYKLQMDYRRLPAFFKFMTRLQLGLVSIAKLMPWILLGFGLTCGIAAFFISICGYAPARWLGLVYLFLVSSSAGLTGLFALRTPWRAPTA